MPSTPGVNGAPGFSLVVDPPVWSVRVLCDRGWWQRYEDKNTRARAESAALLAWHAHVATKHLPPEDEAA